MKLYRSCTGIIPKLYRNCTGVVPELYRSCTGVVPKLYQNCTGVIPELHWSYTGIVPELYRTCTGVIPKLYRNYTGNVPELCRNCAGIVPEFDVMNEERRRAPKKCQDSELQALLDEDDAQTQQQLADQLNVTRDSRLHTFESHGKDPEGGWPKMGST